MEWAKDGNVLRKNKMEIPKTTRVVKTLPRPVYFGNIHDLIILNEISITGMDAACIYFDYMDTFGHLKHGFVPGDDGILKKIN